MLKRSAEKNVDDQTCVLADGTALRYRIEGPPGAPMLLLSNSLGTNIAMWDAQAPVLTQRFRVLRYDSRGHGASTNAGRPYAIAQLARDVLALLDEVEVARVHFCGLSMGGMVGMWLGAHAEERIDRLILCNTAPRIGSAESWNTRIDAVRKGGIEAIADAVIDRWFTAEFRQRASRTVRQMRYMLIANPPEGYSAACAAVRDTDQWDVLPDIGRPTLVVSGAHDMATPPADGRRMAREISGAKYVELDAAHISNVEQPERFTAEVVDFLGA
jgi:3-oxoadipate enol-lactonase